MPDQTNPESTQSITVEPAIRIPLSTTPEERARILCLPNDVVL